VNKIYKIEMNHNDLSEIVKVTAAILAKDKTLKPLGIKGKDNSK
jgi:hypothetical protein